MDVGKAVFCTLAASTNTYMPKPIRRSKKKNLQCQAPVSKSKTAMVYSASESFEEWLKGDVMVRVKPTTYENYYRCLQKYVIPYFKAAKENRITELSVAQFSKHIYENKTISETYKKRSSLFSKWR
jgi:hypothetical protein